MFDLPSRCAKGGCREWQPCPKHGTKGWQNSKSDPLPRDWKSRKIKVAKRDGWVCQRCKQKKHRRLLELDHKIPRFAGGGHDLDNLQLLCAPCHKIKGQEDKRKYR